MNDYIETRPEAIEAIKKAINEKWNLICLGCNTEDLPVCALCMAYGMTCKGCPLIKAYGKGRNATCRCIDLFYSYNYRGQTPAKAEAMLEALVMLLPPEHRIEFGG